MVNRSIPVAYTSGNKRHSPSLTNCDLQDLQVGNLDSLGMSADDWYQGWSNAIQARSKRESKR